MSVGDYVSIIAGRWIRYINGSWDFKLDMTRFGRCVNCKSINGVDNLRTTIAHMYGLDVRVVSVEITYWMEDALAELNGECTQTLDISTNAEYMTFKTLHKTDKSVKVLVTFKEIRGGRLEILGPEEGKVGDNKWFDKWDLGRGTVVGGVREEKSSCGSYDTRSNEKIIVGSSEMVVGEGSRVVEDDFDDCQLIECIEQIEEV